MEESSNITTNPTPEECAVFLGRELSPNETNNYSLFLSVATARLNALLGRDITAWEREADMPVIKLLLSRLVGVVSDEQESALNRGVKAKAVEDFKIDYDQNSSTPMSQFVELNRDLLKLFAAKPILRAGRTDYDGKALCI